MSEALPDRSLLFLDFDGVLHPRPTLAGERFCRLPLLEGWLRERPHVDVVISSSWRFANSLTELRSIFSEDLQSRVISTTSAGGDAGGSREHQIRQWLQYEAPGATWIAIDDSSWLFSRTERLVLCDPNRADGGRPSGSRSPAGTTRGNRVPDQLVLRLWPRGAHLASSPCF